MNVNKRGQITIFAILGLIVFILVFLLFYFVLLSETVDPEDEYEEGYDARLAPLVLNVNYCVEELSKEAFVDIGLSGGRLNTDQVIHGIEPAYVNTGLEIFSGSGLVLPFWIYYEGHPACEDCDLIVNIPPLTGSSSLSISSQVESFVERNLVSCLNYFDDYPDLVIRSEEPDVSITFRDEDVLILLDFPILVEFPDEVEAEVSRFSNSIDLRFRDMYEFAVRLAYQTYFLDENSFFDKSTESILTLMSLGGKDASIPPMVPDFEFGTSSSKMWFKSQVREEVKEVIHETIPHFQVIGSKDSFVPMSLNPYINNIYSGFQFAMELDDREVLSRTKVRFHYFKDWPMFLDVAPSRGELVMPIKENAPMDVPLLGDMGVTNYEFFYDVVFPILITLEEEESFGGEGYFFQFPLTANIMRNHPRNLDLEHLPSISFEGDEFFESGFGSLEQRTVPVSITLLNAYTQEPIYDLPLLYSCGSQGIYIEHLEEGAASSVIETYVPPCVGGVFSVDMVDYYAKPVMDDFLLGTEKSFVMDVFPTKDVEVGVGTFKFRPTIMGPFCYEGEKEKLCNVEDDRGWVAPPPVEGSFGLSPHESESVFIMFRRVQSVGDSEFMRVLVFEDPFESQIVDLVPGDYEVTLFSQFDLGGNLTIENQTYEVGADTWVGGLFVEDEEVFLDEIVFEDSFIVGFMEFGGENLLSLSDAELLFINNLNFVYPSFDISELRFHQDLVVLEMMFNATEDYPDTFDVFKR